MPIEFSIDTKRGLRTHTCSGAVRAEDILKALNALYSREDYCRSHQSLWDFRNCTVSLSSDDMRKIIDFEQKNQKEPGAGKAAIVVSSIIDFGLARMYLMISEYRVNQTLMVFRNYEDAINWLEGPLNE